jgi:hypothetical protein
MKCRLIISLLIIVAFAACKTNADNSTTNGPGIEKQDILVNGIEYKVAGVKQCNYPANDPMLEKKRNKKLVVIRMQVHCVEITNRSEIAPNEAALIDNRGNSYTSSPAIIAIAQNNGCIKGDDIKSYNAIWNATVKKGTTETAWVLGFEIPVDANPEKLYWNEKWVIENIFFLLNATHFLINH